MRLTSLFLIILCMHVSAATLSQTVTLHAKQKPITQVFTAIEAQTGYLIVYNDRYVTNDLLVSLHVKDYPLEDVLKKILSSSALTYQIKGKTIAIRGKREQSTSTRNKTPDFVESQQRTITGMVADENSNPLQGVTVSLKGTTISTTTDTDGKYRLTLSSNARMLVFTAVGYEAIETLVGNQNVVNISLTPTVSDLDEVVVVGYGTQKKSSMTAAVSSVRGEDLKIGPVANVSNTLGGNVSGLITRQSSGEPGSDQSSVLLRGNAPLVLVDGVQRNWDRVNMQDIESISVLKDASAVAPYGLLGANGVILITTKRGKAGTMVLNYSGEYGRQQPTNTPQFMNAYDGLKLRNEALIMDGRPNEVISDEILEQYRLGTDAYPNTDWVSAYLRPSNTQNHNISLNGGSEKIRAFVSLGYLHQGSMYGDNQDYNRYSLRSNLDMDATPTTQLSIDIGIISDEKKANGLNSDDIMLNVYRARATDPDVYSNGLPAFQASLGGSMYNLVHGAGDRSGKNSNQSVIITLKQDVPFVPGLSLKGFYNFDRQANDSKSWSEPYISYVFDSSTGEYVEDNAWLRQKPNLSQSNRVFSYHTAQAFANYENSFNEHRLAATLVYERRWGGRTEWSAARREYDFRIPELNMGSPNKEFQSNSGTSNRTAQDGIIFRANYDFKERYLLEVAGRYDRSFKYAPDRRSAFFPSASLGWRISSEPFFRSAAVSDLKLRASYGISGNPVGSDFAFLQQYLIRNSYVWGVDPIQEQGVYEGVEPNTALTWETVRKANIGLDLTLWGGWLGIAADIYRDFRRDLILAPDAVVPVEYGIGLADENAGKNERYGYDATVTSQGVIFGSLKMRHSFVIGFTRDNRVEIREAAGTYNVPRFRLTGNPSSQLRGYKTAGLFKDQEDIDNWAFQNTSVLPGDIKYVDINGDGKIDTEDRVIIGRTQTPEIMWGYNLGLDYKGFDLGLFFQGTGNSSYYLGQADRGVRFPFDNDKPRADHSNSWTENNPDPNAKYPRLSYAKRTHNYETSDFWVVNTSFARLKSIQLGYTVNPEWSKKFFINNLRIYGNIYNAWTIYSKMPRDFDIETQTYTSYPQQVITSFGVNLTF